MKSRFTMAVVVIVVTVLLACGKSADTNNSGAELTSIAVTPTNPSIAKSTIQQFDAIGTYSDNTISKITTGITWSSSSSDIASVNDSGLATGFGVGSTTIKATSGVISGTSILTVTDAVVISIAVLPQNPDQMFNIPLPRLQFTAAGTFSDNTTQDITTLATWRSSDTSVSTISNIAGSIGIASYVTIGTTTITATFSGITGSTILHNGPGQPQTGRLPR